MALCSEMHNGIGLFETQDVGHRRAVANIDLIEGVVRAILDWLERGKISCVRQAIDVDGLHAKVADQHANESRADKSGPTANDNLHG